MVRQKYHPEGEHRLHVDFLISLCVALVISLTFWFVLAYVLFR